MVVSSTSSGPFIKSTTPYSEINLQIASQWGSLVRGVSTDRRMALQVINHSFFFSVSILVLYSKVFPKSPGIVIIIKDSETRQYTLLFAGCEKKKLSILYFSSRWGLSR